jgi:hypothetical protein
MPITYRGNCAIFEGGCAHEEADALLEWLRNTSDPAADLGACESMHKALLQLLLTARVRVVAPPADGVLASSLGIVSPAKATKKITSRPPPSL